MRISDRSSDVCSSDLLRQFAHRQLRQGVQSEHRHQGVHHDREYRAANEEVGELHPPSPEALSSTIRTAMPLRTRKRPPVISTSPTAHPLRLPPLPSTSAPPSPAPPPPSPPPPTTPN